MSAREAVATYYGLFGVRGVMLAARARSLHKFIETTVQVPRIKHPLHLRLRTSDVSVFRQVFVTSEYEWEFCKSPQTIIDAGANIGLTSVFYANKYPKATIVAIEPELSNFQLLKRNTAPYTNVVALQAALWKNNAAISLVDPNLGHYGFQTVEVPKVSFGHAEYKQVPGVTLDKIMADLELDHVDILKVDIEGTEKEVFENSTSWIDRVGVIIVELHDQLRAGCARSVYLAAKDFEREWRKGETVFLARKAYVADELCQSALMGTSPSANQVRSKPHVKIIQHG